MPVSFSGIRSTSAIGVAQGGTGASELTEGGVLIGHGTNPVTSVTGSDGQVLTWSDAEGAWIAAEPVAGSGGSGGGIASVTTSGNLQGNGTAGSPVTLKANISLTSVTASLKGDGSQITGLTAAQVSGIISSVSSSGNLQGDGTSGSPLTLKNNISLASVTSSFSGNLTGTASFASDADKLDGQDASVFALKNDVSGAIGDFSSRAEVSGALTAYLTSTNAASTYATLSGVSSSFAAISSISSFPSRTEITGALGSYATVTQLNNSLSNISASQISNFNSAVDARITNIPNNALQNSSITINGSPISLGGSVTVADSSTMSFTAAGFAAGDVVALSGSLVKADYSDDTKSNAFGVVSAVSGTSVTVKVFGETTALSASNYATAGTLVYVGPSGSVVNYASIPSGKYITQIGIISPSSGKIIIQPRIFGQK